MIIKIKQFEAYKGVSSLHDRESLLNVATVQKPLTRMPPLELVARYLVCLNRSELTATGDA